MSKTVALGFIAAAVVLAAFYGLGAFIAWDVSPGQWSDGLRVFIGLVGLFFAAVAFGVTAGVVA